MFNVFNVIIKDQQVILQSFPLALQPSIFARKMGNKFSISFRKIVFYPNELESHLYSSTNPELSKVNVFVIYSSSLQE